MPSKLNNLNSLVDLHLQDLLSLRQQFLDYALTTKRADREKLQRAISEIYVDAGVAPPVKIVWLGSPAEVVIAAALWIFSQDSAISQNSLPMEHYSLSEALSQLLPKMDREPCEYAALTNVLKDAVLLEDGSWSPSEKAMLAGNPFMGLHRRLLSPPVSFIIYQVFRALSLEQKPLSKEFRTAHDSNRSRESSSFMNAKIERCLHILHDELPDNSKAWLLCLPLDDLDQVIRTLEPSYLVSRAFHSPLTESFKIALYYALSIFGVEIPEQTRSFLDAVKAGGWWCPLKDICFACDNPTIMTLDHELRLHNDHDMALCFEDGWGFCALEGVRVPEAVILNRISASDIEHERNAQARALMVERFGLARWLVESGAQEKHRDNCGILYSRIVPGQREPMTMLRVTNSTPEPDGSFKDYFLLVPPQMKTARQAVAWTFGLQEHEYDPVQET